MSHMEALNSPAFIYAFRLAFYSSSTFCFSEISYEIWEFFRPKRLEKLIIFLVTMTSLKFYYQCTHVYYNIILLLNEIKKGSSPIKKCNHFCHHALSISANRNLSRK